MSFGSKFINSVCKLSGIKKLYSLPEQDFLQKVEKMNRSRGFFMPRDHKAHYEDELIFGKYHCLKVMQDTAPAKRGILCFYGGGMILDSDKGDLDIVRKLASQTGCDIWYPYYPLCIEHDIRENIEMGFECYRKMIQLYGAGNVSTLGWSSGGMLALSIGLYNNTLPNKLPMPRHIVAVSPGEVPGDTAEAKRMEALNATDYMVDCAFMTKVEKFMRHGKEDIPDWMIHPSMGDYSDFPKIYFYYSSNEVLYGARENFETACKKYGVEYEMNVRDGMFHCYCMMPYFKEAKEDFGKIADLLKA